MLYENFIKILDSTSSQEDIAKKLLEEAKKDPSIPKQKFLCGRTVLHMLAIKKCNYALILLLRNPSFVDVVNTPDDFGQTVWDKITDNNNEQDREGNTILHYVLCLPEKEGKPILQMVLDKLPHLINIENKHNKSPLEEAKAKKKKWAIRGLEEQNKINEKKVKPLMPRLDFTNIQSTQQNKALQNAFPILSARSKNKVHSFQSSSSERSLDSVRSNGSDSVRSENTPAENETGSVSLLDQTSLISELLSPDTDAQNGEYKTYMQQFCNLCEKQDLRTHTNAMLELLRQSDDGIHILNQLLGRLKPLAERRLHQKDKQRNEFTKELMELVQRNGLLKQSNQPKPPKFKKINAKQSRLLKTMWQLTTGEKNEDGSQNFDIPAILNSAVYSGCKMSFEAVVQALADLFPHFNLQQKLIANIIVAQMSAYQHTDDPQEIKNFKECLNKFKQCNINKTHGLKAITATKLNLLLDKFLTQALPLTDDLQLINVSCLSKMHNSLIPPRPLIDFRTELEHILNSPQDKRDILPLVRELRGVTEHFYRTLSLNALTNNKPVELDTGIAIADYFNKLSNYLTNTILSIPPNQISNMLSLLLQVVQSLCSLDAETRTDFHTAMCIFSALSNTAISRLTETDFSKLSENLNILRHELQTLLSNKKNYHWMRQIQDQKQNTVPYFGLIKSDMTFISENTKRDKSELSGKILISLLQLKQSLSHSESLGLKSESKQNTNLLELITDYTPISNEELYDKSCLLLPEKINLDTILYTDLVARLKRLNTTYLKNGLIPRYIIDGRECNPSENPSQFAFHLLTWVQMKLDEIYTELNKSELQTNQYLLYKEIMDEYKNALPDLLKDISTNLLSLQTNPNTKAPVELNLDGINNPIQENLVLLENLLHNKKIKNKTIKEKETPDNLSKDTIIRPTRSSRSRSLSMSGSSIFQKISKGVRQGKNKPAKRGDTHPELTKNSPS